MTDEYTVTFPAGQKIGLSLEDFGSRGKYRVYVKKIRSGSLAARAGVKVPALIVAVNGQNVEGLRASMVKQLIDRVQEGDLIITFRDPTKFEELVEQTSTTGQQELQTTVAPESKQRAQQVLKVRKESLPEVCNVKAEIGDLLEISYITSLDDGTVVDASNAQVAGRGGDTTIFFVLGRQPLGQFPRGWDLSLIGACVGERRIVTVPPVLAYGQKGLWSKGVPPDTSIIYDITVVGINGVNAMR